jgi:nucleoside-diphosphate-sugar epimerase
MKVFITGATGFIGKHLVNFLLNNGHDVTVNIHRQHCTFPDSVKTYTISEIDANKDIQFFKTESFDGIIHLASLYITTHKPDDVTCLINSNVCFGAYILECAAQSHIKWFINTGTFWQNFQNKDYSPVNLYAATKQALESIAQFYVETNQIKFVTLRLSDTYGPNDTRQKIFNLWDKIAKTGETLDMSPGEQLIDISHVDDVVSAFVLLSQHLQNNHPNICNGDVFAVKALQRYTLRELANIYEEVTGKKLNINWGGRPYREREVMSPCENIQVVPNWQAKTSLLADFQIFMGGGGGKINP